MNLPRTASSRTLRAVAAAAILALLASLLVLAASPGAQAARPGTLTSLGCIGDTGPVDTGDNTCDVGASAQPGSDLMGGTGVPVVDETGTRVYVSSYDDDAVTWFSRSATGVLTQLGCIADAPAPPPCAEAQGLDRAWGLVLSPDGQQLYVAGQGDSAVVTLDVAADGSLSDRGCISYWLGVCGTTTDGLLGAYNVAISDDGKDVYTSAYDADGLVQLRRSPSGELSPASCLQVVPAGSCTAAPGIANPWQAVVSHDGDNVYVASEEGAIAVFDRDGSTGALSAARCVSDAQVVPRCGTIAEALAGAFSVTISKDDDSVYVAASVDSAVTHLRRAADGNLTDAGCVEDVGKANGCADKAQGLDQVAFVRVAPDDDQVLASSIGDNAVTVLNRGGTGALTGSSCIGDAPDDGNPTTCATSAEGLNGSFSLAIAPDGRNVYVGGYSESALVMLARKLSGPVVTLKAAAKQRAGQLAARIGCDARCTAAYTGVIVAKAEGRPARTFKLKPGSLGALRPGQRVVVPLRLKTKDLRTVTRLVNRGAKATLTLKVRATNNGGATTKKAKIALKK